MTQLTAYRFKFRSGFHLGTRGVNLEERSLYFPSDTLFAALVDALRRMGYEPDDFVQPFPRADAPGAGSPPFALTSTFPFVGELRFFPMPTGLQRWFSEQALTERRKEVKRIAFVSEALFRRMLAGERLDDWLFPQKKRTEPTRGVALQGGTFWMTLGECAQLSAEFEAIPPRALRQRAVYAAGRVPHVTVDRISSASEIFHAGRVTFAPGCGLWFGVDWRGPDAPAAQDGTTYRQAFDYALRLLEEEGLGGGRNVGYGAFELESRAAALDLDAPAPGGLALLLSRYHPRPAELPAALDDQGAAYSLFPVGGWLSSWDGAAQRRKRLWMVSEGSVVRAVGQGPWGDLVDVRPTGDLPHPVWRYGLALGVGLQEVRA